MKTFIRFLFPGFAAACLAASAVPAFAAGETAASPVTVTFQDPERFTDVRDGEFETERGRDYTLDQLRKYIERRAGAVLPAGYTLKIVVSDVDLAGDYEPWHFPLRDVRIVRDLYPPRIQFSYTVTDASGRVVSEASRTLTDLAFLQTIMPDRNDTLRFEKALIDSWTRVELKRATAS